MKLFTIERVSLLRFDVECSFYQNNKIYSGFCLHPYKYLAVVEYNNIVVTITPRASNT